MLDLEIPQAQVVGRIGGRRLCRQDHERMSLSGSAHWLGPLMGVMDSATAVQLVDDCPPRRVAFPREELLEGLEALQEHLGRPLAIAGSVRTVRPEATRHRDRPPHGADLHAVAGRQPISQRPAAPVLSRPVTSYLDQLHRRGPSSPSRLLPTTAHRKCAKTANLGEV